MRDPHAAGFLMCRSTGAFLFLTKIRVKIISPPQKKVPSHTSYSGLKLNTFISVKQLLRIKGSLMDVFMKRYPV